MDQHTETAGLRRPGAAWRGTAARLRGDERGAPALEFALVLPVFLFCVFVIFQLGILFITQELMDNAARDVARLMRIGTLTGKAYASTLTTDVCNDLAVSGVTLIPSCSQNIQIYVAAVASGTPAGSGFTTLTTASVSNGVMTTTKAALASKYDVVLQIGYDFPWSASWLQSFTGNTMLVSTVAFQTEPY